MSRIVGRIRQELQASADEKTRKSFPIFFKEQVTYYGVKTATVRKIAKNRKPVEDYLKLQGRFKHLFAEAGKEELEKIRQIAQANIDKYGLE